MNDNTNITKNRRHSHNLLALLLAVAVLCGATAAGAALAQALVPQDSVYALSRLGSTGEEVRRVQTKLRSLGFYKGSVDGIYGTQTRNAVLAFQRSCGITADGIAGKQTLLYLGLSGGSAGSGANGFSGADVELLAKVISAEARGESYEGQVAVGAVILNRIASPSFPDTLSGVVYQRGAFSCVYDANWYQPVAASAKRAAQDAMNGWDPSGGALYYYNPAKTSNAWMRSRTVIKVIGSHRFCI